jgi:hypothetical protein
MKNDLYLRILARTIVMRSVTEKNETKGKLLILVVVIAGILSSSLGERWSGLTELWSLTPLLWLEANSRRSAFFIVFTYYLALSRGIVPGAYVFFRDIYSSIYRLVDLQFQL